MLHGKAVIELHNMRTHQSKRIVHHNMLTNWASDYMKPPAFLHTMIGDPASASSRTWGGISPTIALGGLMMFGSQLSSDATDYLFPRPSVAKMIAHGNREAYSGTDVSRGSFNAAQSSQSAGNLTQVWDFTQEQGNGTIASLGLCHNLMGKIGSGQDVDSENDSTGKVNLYSNNAQDGYILGATAALTPVSGRYYSMYINKVTGYCYTMTLNNGKITTKKKKLPLGERLNLLDETIPTNIPPYLSNLTSAETITEVDVSSHLGNTNAGAAWVDAVNGVLYLLDLRSAWTSGSKTLVAFDIEAGTFTTSTVTNNTGVQLGVAPYGYETGCFAISGGLLYIPRYNSKEVYYINLADNTDCGKVQYNDGTDFNIGNNFAMSKCLFLQWGSMLMCSDQLYRDVDTYTYPAKLIDAKKAYHLNLVAPSTMSGGITNVACQFPARLIVANCAAGGNNVITTQPIYGLATKNNLESAVTKTADMTMRVTYTVTDQAE